MDKSSNYRKHYNSLEEAISLNNSLDCFLTKVLVNLLAKYQKLWIKRGIYLLMDKLRVIIWRNLIKKVSISQGVPKIPIVNI